ncbi:VIRB2 type IV secretion [Brucella intermedia]|uniref:TrbC/VirB2 family protein n=1 Tax=Brucella intermedia TaxID=94625 RepID=UPI00124F1546|nr:TrbC/VirB2 family protein [Brucella intermedia]KAB2716273.1 VIRB2 type IV secretion [Brucella intermedia]
MDNGINTDWRVTTTKLAICLTLLAAMQVAGADLAMAQNTGDVAGAFGPIQKVVQAIIDFINGSFGRLLATIAVMGLGFLAFAGRLSWFFAGSVILGIGLVFGAHSMVEALIDTVGKN